MLSVVAKFTPASAATRRRGLFRRLDPAARAEIPAAGEFQAFN